MINYNQTNDNCCAPMQVLPDDDMRRWACKQVVTMLANSDYYYTRDEVDRLIASIEPDITKEEVEQMIYQATSGKQNTLIAGDGIDITNDVISVTGGSIDSGAVQTMIDQSISGKSDTTAVTAVNDALTAHTSNTDIHVTTSDKQAWNAKADLSDIPSVSGYADSVMYNSSTHYVEFYHGGTGGTKVFEYDASPFIIDGMVQNVEIKDVTISGESVTCLVVSFNTDAGHQDINIPISEIFDASNYYTKDNVDAIVSGLTQRIAEDEEVSSYGLSVLDEKKQDVLWPGEGISIVNNVISATNGGTNVSVSGTTLIFN